MKVNCHCKNVDFGTYDNQVSMKNPYGKRKNGWISVDTCIATVIGYLWHNGIETLNSCCGHKKLPPTVIVSENSVNKMKNLGYKNSKIKCNTPNQIFDL